MTWRACMDGVAWRASMACSAPPAWAWPSTPTYPTIFPGVKACSFTPPIAARLTCRYGFRMASYESGFDEGRFHNFLRRYLQLHEPNLHPEWLLDTCGPNATVDQYSYARCGEMYGMYNNWSVPILYTSAPSLCIVSALSAFSYFRPYSKPCPCPTSPPHSLHSHSTPLRRMLQVRLLSGILALGARPSLPRARRREWCHLYSTVRGSRSRPAPLSPPRPA